MCTVIGHSFPRHVEEMNVMSTDNISTDSPEEEKGLKGMKYKIHDNWLVWWLFWPTFLIEGFPTYFRTKGRWL